jgi:hypothetical protein
MEELSDDHLRLSVLAANAGHQRASLRDGELVYHVGVFKEDITARQFIRTTWLGYPTLVMRSVSFGSGTIVSQCIIQNDRLGPV